MPDIQSPFVHQLQLTLEQLHSGVVKRAELTYLSDLPSKILIIDVKPGSKSGTRITFENEQVAPGENADIVFEIAEKEHKRFVRSGTSLIHKWTVSAYQAKFGCQLEMQCIDGSTVLVDLSKVVLHSGYRHVVTGKGMPILKQPGCFGNLIVEIHVLPDSMPDSPLPTSNESQSLASSQTCVICCEDFEQADVMSLPCGHSFHTPCINNWLARHRTCPHCRHPC